MFLCVFFVFLCFCVVFLCFWHSPQGVALPSPGDKKGRCPFNAIQKNVFLLHYLYAPTPVPQQRAQNDPQMNIIKDLICIC